MGRNLLMHRLTQLNRMSHVRCQTSRLFATKSDEKDIEIPSNPLKEVYSATYQKENGVVYDKKPFKVFCEEGKTYHWCLCGQSKSQPFCDGTHNNIFLKIKIRPIKFTVTKSKDYWLCNCKQTLNRPFCDGTHKKPEVQEITSFTRK